jgi:tellurite methyltransferase
MATIEEWNERYRSDTTDEREPSPVVVRAAALSTPGRAIDLACGTGRNSLFLARQGWDVVAIDGATEAIRLLRDAAAAAGLAIATAVIDLERQPIGHHDVTFDLVVITHYLQRELFTAAATLLVPGGLCAAAIHLTHPSGRGQRYRLAPGELRRLFGDWDVVDYREENGTAEIIARRPG